MKKALLVLLLALAGCTVTTGSSPACDSPAAYGYDDVRWEWTGSSWIGDLYDCRDYEYYCDQYQNEENDVFKVENGELFVLSAGRRYRWSAFGMWYQVGLSG